MFELAGTKYNPCKDPCSNIAFPIDLGSKLYAFAADFILSNSFNSSNSLL